MQATSKPTDPGYTLFCDEPDFLGNLRAASGRGRCWEAIKVTTEAAGYGSRSTIAFSRLSPASPEYTQPPPDHRNTTSSTLLAAHISDRPTYAALERTRHPTVTSADAHQLETPVAPGSPADRRSTRSPVPSTPDGSFASGTSGACPQRTSGRRRAHAAVGHIDAANAEAQAYQGVTDFFYEDVRVSVDRRTTLKLKQPP
jgi:hypothetical protein